MADFVEQTWEEIVAIHNAPILAAIDGLSAKIEKAENLYNLLLEFKGKVERYHIDFVGVSSQKKLTLNNLDTMVLYCDAKNLYRAGMDATYIDMVDNRLEESVFGIFFTQIDTKLQAYLDDIDRWECECRVLRATLW